VAGFSPQALALQAMARVHASRTERAALSVMQGVPDRLREWDGVADFCAQYLRIKPIETADELVPLRFNWMQQRIVAEERKARAAGVRPWFLILKFRKGGVTTLEQALSYWDCWRQPHRDCVTLAHEDRATDMIFRMVSRFYENQPTHRHRKTQARVSQIEFPDWDALYIASTAGRGKVGRGSTFARAHLSEAAWYSDLRKIHTGMSESIGPSSAYVLETTANGRDGEGEAFFAFWEAAKQGRTEFIPLFFAWHNDPANRLAVADPDEYAAILADTDDEVAQLIARHRLTPEQAWWWIKKRRALVADGRSMATIHQEFPSDDEKAFLVASPGYYDAAMCEDAAAKCVEPIRVEDNGRLRIFELPDPDRPASYIAGCDPSGGVRQDDAGIVGFNHRTGRQAFTWKANDVPPDRLGEIILPLLGTRWANPATKAPVYWVIERNNHGHTVLAMAMKKAEYPKDRIYHQTDDSKVDQYGNTEASATAGWNHTTTGHADLTNAIGRMVREDSPSIRDLDVMRSIQRVGTGPTGAVFTGRDLAVAAGLAQIGWADAGEPAPWAFIGGKVVEF